MLFKLTKLFLETSDAILVAMTKYDISSGAWQLAPARLVPSSIFLFTHCLLWILKVNLGYNIVQNDDLISNRHDYEQ
jgi:hypothetical protein